MKQLNRIIFLLLSGLMCCACAFAEDLPRRIISLGPFITGDLVLLGAQDRIVGVTAYCPDVETVRDKERVGNVVEVNVEKIVSLGPDLVLATPLTGVKAKEALRKLGIRVVDMPQAKNFSDICGQFLMLGELVGAKEKAEEIISEAREKVDVLRKQAAAMPRKKVFVQVGSRPLFTMNRDYFINDIINLAGGINIAEHAGSGMYSREKVVEENPDIIIITTMGIAGEQEMAAWRAFPGINAVKENKIFIIDSNMFCVPTPFNFCAALERVAAFLQEGEKPHE
ncbi:MAG: ABC transporter substrate-binding protein [Candidatus Omnitrophica bacterium]|nr:ABC transporter substrate-binding protein [Candidatus Omnitrophota bacterium]MCG2702941.1 helical backbone metal receptor [Candidatus Omnitrophota bacterium]